MNLAADNHTANSPAFPTGIAAKVWRIYHGVCLLSTMKSDSILRKGQQEDLDTIRMDGWNCQDSIRTRL